MLPKIDRIIKKDISIQQNDDALKTLFSKDCFSTIYKRNKNLKELIAPSIYPKKALEEAVLKVLIIAIFARIT